MVDAAVAVSSAEIVAIPDGGVGHLLPFHAGEDFLAAQTDCGELGDVAVEVFDFDVSGIFGAVGGNIIDLIVLDRKALDGIGAVGGRADRLAAAVDADAFHGLAVDGVKHLAADNRVGIFQDRVEFQGLSRGKTLGRDGVGHGGEAFLLENDETGVGRNFVDGIGTVEVGEGHLPDLTMGIGPLERDVHVDQRVAEGVLDDTRHRDIADHAVVPCAGLHLLFRAGGRQQQGQAGQGQSKRAPK